MKTKQTNKLEAVYLVSQHKQKQARQRALAQAVGA
jgi:hypothetical protein